MRNELTILNALQTTLAEGLSETSSQTLPALTADSVALEFPDVDSMPRNTMIYIQPNYANYEDQSVMSDAAEFSVAIFIVCKKDQRGNLTKKVYGYYNEVYKVLMDSMSLNGNIDFCRVTDADFYPAVEGRKDVQAIEITLRLKYTKDY